MRLTRLTPLLMLAAGLAVALSGRTAAQSPEPRDSKRIDFARDVSHRPPIESSDIGATALSLRSLQAYAPAPLKAGYASAVQRGAAWLSQAQSKSNQDYVYRVLGLAWASASRSVVRSAVTALITAVKPIDPAYQRGVRFLLDTQLEDGSWYVRSRAIPIQPYLDSEFPHSKDQFISAAATNWATMALTWTVVVR
jgi:hypothetical protein